MCSFQCDAGYELVGLRVQTCLSNGMWSGNASCKILHCDLLPIPNKGNILLPCGTELNTACRILCDPGYYAADPFQRCELREGNVAEWTEPPECIG